MDRQASTNVSVQQAIPDAALVQLMQHMASCSNQPQLHDVCSLLSTSSTMQRAAARHSAGRTAVAHHCKDWQAAMQFASWLRNPQLGQHGHIMQSLQLELPTAPWCRWPAGDPDDTFSKQKQQVEAAIVAGLQQAAAAAPGGRLLLQAFSSSTPSSAILQQLACCAHITKLELNFDDESTGPDSKAAFSQTTAAMSHLTALHSARLSLCYEADPWVRLAREVVGVEEVLPGLAAATRLTYLELFGVADGRALQHVPVQLQKLCLDVSVTDNMSDKPLRLGHLTALTELTHNRGSDSGHTVTKGDVFPPNIEVLCLGDMVCVQPLLNLRQLKVLCMDLCCAPAEQLRQISSLTALTEVQLVHEGGGDSEATSDAAPAWSSLPLRALTAEVITVEGVFSPILHHLGMQQGLTRLTVHHRQQRSAATGDADVTTQLAGLLPQLTRLQLLYLSGPSGSLARKSVGQPAVIQAITHMPQLVSLDLWEMPGVHAAAAALRTATQLTALRLDECSLADITVNAIVCGLPQLKFLGLNHNSAVTDAVTPVIAWHVSQLTALHLRCTAVTDIGIEYLSCLKQLQALSVPEGVSAAAKKGLCQAVGGCKIGIYCSRGHCRAELFETD